MICNTRRAISFPDLRKKLEDSYLQQVNSLPQLGFEFTPTELAILDNSEARLLAKKQQQEQWEKERASYKPFTPALQAKGLVRTLPPPKSASPTASLAIAKELKRMLKAQEEESPQSLGYYFE